MRKRFNAILLYRHFNCTPLEKEFILLGTTPITGHSVNNNTSVFIGRHGCSISGSAAPIRPIIIQRFIRVIKGSTQNREIVHSLLDFELQRRTTGMVATKLSVLLFEESPSITIHSMDDNKRTNLRFLTRLGILGADFLALGSRPVRLKWLLITQKLRPERRRRRTLWPGDTDHRNLTEIQWKLCNTTDLVFTIHPNNNRVIGLCATTLHRATVGRSASNNAKRCDSYHQITTRRHPVTAARAGAPTTMAIWTTFKGVPHSQ